MKVLAVLVLCAFVAVQGRSAAGKRELAVAARGDAPWLVHLRLAVSTSGLLNTGAGALISDRWVLTAADAVEDARFIWVRYGAATVINPVLVTETSITTAPVVPSSDEVLALVNINRSVDFTGYISPVSLAARSLPSSAVIFAYGLNDEGAPGEVLTSFSVSLSEDDGAIVASSDESSASIFDLGAPLVIDGVLYGVLVKSGSDDNAGEFVSPAGYLDWIQEATGIERSSAQ